VPKGADGLAETGTWYVPAGAAAKAVLDKADATLGVKAIATDEMPADAKRMTSLRIGLWDQYGGSMPSGWLRLLMEQNHFEYTKVFPQEIDAGGLNSKYDVIVFVTRAIPAIGGEQRSYYDRMPKAEDTPAEFHKMLGKITPEKSIPQLKSFLEAGGHIVTIGSSANLAYHLGLPVHSALVDKDNKPLPGTKYYIPGSILHASVDPAVPAAWGMPADVDVNFDNSPVFKLDDDAAKKGVTPVLWFPTDKPLRSGWAWGQSYLKDGVAGFVASVGAGKLYTFGPEITFRGQSLGTFKLLFNQFYGMSAE